MVRLLMCLCVCGAELIDKSVVSGILNSHRMELLKSCDFEFRMFADLRLVIENFVYIGQTDPE